MDYYASVDRVCLETGIGGGASKSFSSIAEADAYARQLIEEAYQREGADEPLDFKKLEFKESTTYYTHTAEYIVCLRVDYAIEEELMAFLCGCLKRDGLQKIEKTLAECGIADGERTPEIYRIVREFADYYGIKE